MGGAITPQGENARFSGTADIPPAPLSVESIHLPDGLPGALRPGKGRFPIFRHLAHDFFPIPSFRQRSHAFSAILSSPPPTVRQHKKNDHVVRFKTTDQLRAKSSIKHGVGRRGPLSAFAIATKRHTPLRHPMGMVLQRFQKGWGLDFPTHHAAGGARRLRRFVNNPTRENPGGLIPRIWKLKEISLPTLVRGGRAPLDVDGIPVGCDGSCLPCRFGRRDKGRPHESHHRVTRCLHTPSPLVA